MAGPGQQEPVRSISRHYQRQHLPTHWTQVDQPPLNTYHYQCGATTQQIASLSLEGRLRKISNFVLIIFPWSTLSHSPYLGKTETEKTLMILSFFSSSLEQGHYLHLVYLVLTSFTHLLLDQAALCVSVRSTGLS